jgi:hypothetical protein
MPAHATTIVPAALALILACGVGADTVTLTPAADNTLIQDPNGAYSSGQSQYFFAGRVGENGGGTFRRGVVRFDCAEIPSGSTVQSATVKLWCSAAGSSASYSVALKRATAAWGEGASVAFGGGGANSAPGDATWLHRFYPDVFWSVPGGDFIAAASATRNVGATNQWYTWTSTAALVADVQTWVNDGSTNFGWVVQGNETTLKSVKRFDSSEAGPATRPQLIIVFTPPPPPIVGDLNGDGAVNAADLTILLAQWGSAGSADLNGSGAVDGADLATLLANWTA